MAVDAFDGIDLLRRLHRDEVADRDHAAVEGRDAQIVECMDAAGLARIAHPDVDLVIGRENTEDDVTNRQTKK